MRKLLPLVFIISSVIAGEKEYDAIITHYCNCQKCCSWEYKNGVPVFKSNGKPKIIGQTASGTQAKEGRTLALPKSIPFKSVVFLPNGEKIGICEDRGGKIIETDKIIKIDKFVNSHEEAIKLGKYSTKVKIVSHKILLDNPKS